MKSRFALSHRLLCLLCVAQAACGGETQFYPNPSYEQELAGYGESCAKITCRSGLACRAEVCDWQTCAQAPVPADYCAQQTGASSAVCVNGACANRPPNTFNQPCARDPDVCDAQSVCIQGRCQPTCDVAGRACPGGFVCVDSSEGLYCGVERRCDQQRNPDQWCARELDLPTYQATCAFGQCVPSKQQRGEQCEGEGDCADELACYKGSCQRKCQTQEQCDDTELCLRSAGVCVFDSASTCTRKEIPAVACAVKQGEPLATAHCSSDDTCEQLDDVPWPVLLIKDAHGPQADCARNAGAWDLAGTTPVAIFATPLDGMGADHVDVDILRYEVIQPDASFSQNASFFKFQSSRNVNVFTSYLCNDRFDRSDYFGQFPPLSLGCQGKVYARLRKQGAPAAEIVSLSGGTDDLTIGWLRTYCQGVTAQYEEVQAQVLRCRADVFDVGDEQACEPLVEVNGGVNTTLSRYLLP